LGKAGKVFLAIILVIVGLFGMAYFGSTINENSKSIDKLKVEDRFVREI
jgi:hypothetical protein